MRRALSSSSVSMQREGAMPREMGLGGFVGQETDWLTTVLPPPLEARRSQLVVLLDSWVETLV